jgi:hypothetical protein
MCNKHTSSKKIEVIHSQASSKAVIGKQSILFIRQASDQWVKKVIFHREKMHIQSKNTQRTTKRVTTKVSTTQRNLSAQSKLHPSKPSNECRSIQIHKSQKSIEFVDWKDSFESQGKLTSQARVWGRRQTTCLIQASVNGNAGSSVFLEALSDSTSA